MIETLRKLICIPSVLSPAQENAPFGKENRKALDTFLAIAKEMGFTTHDGDGYYGWAEYGDGEKMIGLACHIDVVPATGKWDYPEYELTVKDGLLYGRGVADDKGPIAVMLHVMKKLKDDGVKLKHRLRLIVGCNEENGSLCMEHYVKVDEIPSFTLVPDADFPVVNSEKGILNFDLTLSSRLFELGLEDICGGKRPNIIPDLCSAIIKKDSALYNAVKNADKASLESVCAPAKLEISDKGLTTYGIAGHAMCPDRGVNAVFGMIKVLNKLTGELSEFAALCDNDACKTLGIYKADEQSGDLTANLGIIKSENGKIVLTYNCRLPICSTPDEVVNGFSKGMNATSDNVSFSPNLFISKDNPVIVALVDAYCAVTGDVPHCVYTGGGTYARSIPNAVAYGPTFENTETNIHNANENIPLDHLIKTGEIYEKAIKKLDQLL